MRVNVYAEEMTDRIEIISKEIDGHVFTGLRFYLALPASMFWPPNNSPRPATLNDQHKYVQQMQAPFIHRENDDDSAAVTFWGKRDLREVLQKALMLLDKHYYEENKRLTGP